MQEASGRGLRPPQHTWSSTGLGEEWKWKRGDAGELTLSRSPRDSPAFTSSKSQVLEEEVTLVSGRVHSQHQSSEETGPPHQPTTECGGAHGATTLGAMCAHYTLCTLSHMYTHTRGHSSRVYR